MKSTYIPVLILRVPPQCNTKVLFPPDLAVIGYVVKPNRGSSEKTLEIPGLFFSKK